MDQKWGRIVTRQSGFTLVEIAIVLVIIGLLLGGVLKGQELINQAKIKNLANDINGISAAVYGYQDRYKKLPGDDNSAATRWTSPTAASNGNGNGVVEGCYNAAATCTAGITGGITAESVQFWDHLRRSGFVGGSTGQTGAQALPQNAVGGYLGVQTGAIGMAGLVICSANINGKLASALDSQLDDGSPATGTMRATAITTLNDLPATTSASCGGTTPSGTCAYTADDTAMYVVCKSL